MSEIRIDVKTSGDDGPIKKVTQATDDLAKSQEKLSNSGKGLATAPSDISAPQESRQPLTMEDLGAIEKVTEALQRKIAINQALGESTVEQEAALQKLNTALQSEEARTLVVARAELRLAEAKREAAKANDANGRSLNEVIPYAKKYAEENQNLRNIAQGVNIELPILGRVINTLTSPMSAAAGATAILVGGLVKLYHEATKANEYSNAAQWVTMSKGLDNAADSASHAAAEAMSFERSLQAIATAQDSVSAATDKTISKIKQQASAMLELQNAEAALKIAQIDAAEKSGKISSVDAITARTSVRDEYERKKNEVKNKASSDEIAAREAEQKNLENQTGPLTQRKDETAKAAEEVKEREIANAERIANAKKNVEAEKANRKKLEEELEKVNKENFESVFFIDFQKKGDLEQQIRLSKKSEAAAQGVVDTGKTTAPSRENDLKATQEAAAEAAKKLKENEIAKAKVSASIPELKSSATDDAATRATVAELDRKKRAVESQSRIEEEQRKEAERKAREDERARKKAQEDIEHGRNFSGGGPDGANAAVATAGDKFKDASQNVAAGIAALGDTTVAGQTAIVGQLNITISKIQKDLASLASQVATRRV